MIIAYHLDFKKYMGDGIWQIMTFFSTGPVNIFHATRVQIRKASVACSAIVRCIAWEKTVVAISDTPSPVLKTAEAAYVPTVGKTTTVSASK